MTIARHYVMNAAEGKDATLETVLRDLADIVRKVDGCEGVELLRDLGNERRFIFIEKWVSVEAHGAGAKQVPKDISGRLGPSLDGPPDGAYFDYLKVV